MPILPPEPDVFPPSLLDDPLPCGEEPSSWWALYTLARREKDLMRRLRCLEIAHYGPMLERRTRSPAGRALVSRVPLFPSYVFLYGSESARYQAVATGCVSRCLLVEDAQQLLRDLRQLRTLIQSGTPLTPEAQLMAGMKVRIKSGSLQGTEGVILKRHGVDRLLVAVHFLQRGVSMQIEDYQLERID